MSAKREREAYQMRDRDTRQTIVRVSHAAERQGQACLSRSSPCCTRLEAGVGGREDESVLLRCLVFVGRVLGLWLGSRGEVYETGV
jgi:hypothetical protein